MILQKNDTIAAIATAHGIGAISIVRISGENALNLALRLLKIQTLRPRYAKFCKIYSLNGDQIDEGIVIYFKAPNSFTAENVVEFQTHGGFLVAQMILDELCKIGCRIAKPGEFSKRAFLNGKMDLCKAYAIQNLINARCEDGLKILSRQMQGELGKFCDDLRKDLVKTLAYVETSIDYADDDLPKDILDQTKSMLKANFEKLNKIVTISQSKKGLIEGFKIAIIGKPNVGKSSVLNAFLHYNRAIVSNKAGTTRDSVEESVKISTHLVRIIDTAGIREKASSLEKIGIKKTLEITEKADIIVAIFDGSKKFDKEDEKILQLCKNCNKKVIFVLNKADLPRKFNQKIPNLIKICAKKDVNLLLKSLENYLDSQNYDGLMLSQNSQILACENAQNAILRALNLLNERELELFAFELNLAISHIASITRPFERSEILDEMFLSFCLGK